MRLERLWSVTCAGKWGMCAHHRLLAQAQGVMGGSLLGFPSLPLGVSGTDVSKAGVVLCY